MSSDQHGAVFAFLPFSAQLLLLMLFLNNWTE
jgi:hypothetical protein